jgi:hypothetical protein
MARRSAGVQVDGTLGRRPSRPRRSRCPVPRRPNYLSEPIPYRTKNGHGRKSMSNHNSGGLRGLWLAIIVLSGLFTGAVTGAVLYAAGAQLPTAIAAAGGAFFGAITLGLSMWNFLAE